MREVTFKVSQDKPMATEITKLDRKDLTSYIYVGTPINQQMYGSEPRIQLDQQLATVDEVQEFVIAQRENIIEKERTKFTISLKADGMVKMGLITDIKEELKEAQSYLINYSTVPAPDSEAMFEKNFNL